MEINKTLSGTELLIELEGRLDTNTAPKLEASINESLAETTDLVFDFNDLDYISSAGLRVLLSAQKAMNRKGSMKILNVKDEIMEIFEVTGFDTILTIL